jgi:hypothetical protein
MGFANQLIELFKPYRFLLWQDSNADLVGFAFPGARENVGCTTDSSAGAGAEPGTAERRRRRDRGRGRLQLTRVSDQV